MEGFMPHNAPNATDKTLYNFNFESLQGQPMPLSQFEGKAVLLVNTASECGYTPQYKGLQQLSDKYAAKGLVVLGVPCNDFGAQEPGNSKEISQFCEVNYGVRFPLSAKQVVSGEKAHPVYKWLDGVLGSNSAPKWNFHKFLIGRDGKPLDYFPSNVAPDSDKLVKSIERALGGP